MPHLADVSEDSVSYARLSAHRTVPIWHGAIPRALSAWSEDDHSRVGGSSASLGRHH